MPSPSPSRSQALPEQTATPAQPAVTGDHPGINELFALLAYGEVAAFYRLTEEARMAPNLAGRINLQQYVVYFGFLAIFLFFAIVFLPNGIKLPRRRRLKRKVAPPDLSAVDTKEA